MKSLRRSYDKKRSTIRWMKQTQLQPAAAEAQSGENESDPDLDLRPPASPVGNTFWCQCGECFARDRSKTGLRLLFWLCRARGETEFTQRRTTARRSKTVAVDLPLFARIFLQLLVLDGVERLFGHDQAPSKCLPQQQVSGNLLFFATYASLPRRWIVHSPLYFFYKFWISQFRAAIEVAEQPPNKCRRNSSFLVNRWKLTPSFRCLLYLLQPKAQQKTVFSVAAQLGWLCHARNPLDRRAVQKPWNCQLAERQTRRVDVFYQNLPHVRNSESRFTFTCLPRSRFLCDRRPTSASRKLEICATRATNKVHTDEQPVWESKKRSLTSF